MGASVLSAHAFQHAVAVELAGIADDIVVFTAIAAGNGYSYLRGDELLQLKLLEDAPPCAGLSPRPGELSVAQDRSLAFGVLGAGAYGIAGIERPSGALLESELFELALLIRGLGLAADYALGRRLAPRAETLLSPREREVSRMLVEGYANLNVAAHLGISENTIRTYIRRLYKKLNVCNRIDLIRACAL
jgi:DNA-binding CsgD family transcriptional regulator